MEFDVKDLNLSADGKKKIEWAQADMPVLKGIMEEFSKKKPLEGATVAHASM